MIQAVVYLPTLCLINSVVTIVNITPSTKYPITLYSSIAALGRTPKGRWDTLHGSTLYMNEKRISVTVISGIDTTAQIMKHWVVVIVSSLYGYCKLWSLQKYPPSVVW